MAAAMAAKKMTSAAAYAKTPATGRGGVAASGSGENHGVSSENGGMAKTGVAATNNIAYHGV